jgi:methionyl-tRNA formyltransferase
MNPLRCVFFGTAALAGSSLEALARQPWLTLAAVVTQPDRPRGRRLQFEASPVKTAALRLGLPVCQPAKCRAPEFIEALRALGPELIVVAAYGQILPPPLLDLPRLGCVNVHASLLPQYRGAAPIQWALLDGATRTGITIMRMDPGLDTGDILSQESLAIDPAETAPELHDRLAALGADLLVRTLPGFAEGRISGQPQPSAGASYARKIVKEDGQLDWALPATVLANRVRALQPWPGTFTYLPAAPHPLLLRVLRAMPEPAPGAGAAGHPGTVIGADAAGVRVACGTGVLRLLELQREGGRPLAARDFLAGRPMPVGTRLAWIPHHCL